MIVLTFSGIVKVSELLSATVIAIPTISNIIPISINNKVTRIATNKLTLGITVSDSIHYYSGLVPAKDGKVSSVYGLSDIYHKSKYYKGFVDEFERKIGEQLSIEKNKTL